MKILLLILFLIPFPFLSYGSPTMTHDQIVDQMQKGKVGKAPQMGRTSVKPKYNTASEIKGKKKHKKHHRKSSYAK